MAITVNLVANGGTTSQTVASGASVQVTPSTRVQIVVDGVVIDPATVTTTVNPPHVTFTLPDGQQITLLNFVDLQGGAGGGLVGADGTLVLASTLEALSAPAAGGPDGGGDGGGDANLSTFNQADPFENAEFGTGGGGLGPDITSPTGGIGDDGDPFELIIALPAPPGVEPVVIVVPLVPTPTPDTPAPDTPPVVIPDPTLALLIINEIGVTGNTSGSAFIEFFNNSGVFQTTAGNLVTITGPGGTPVVVALPDATVPPGGFLVIRENGTFETFDSVGTSLGTGAFATAPWGMGADTTEALLVALTFGAAVTDLFQANGLAVVGPGWIPNAAGTAAVPDAFLGLFDHDGFSGYSGDIDGVLSSLGLSRPVVSLDPSSGIVSPHAPHPAETVVENTVFARVFGPLDGTPSDSDSEVDWTTSNTPTQGGFNSAPGDINPQDGTSPDDFDPAQNAGTNDPIAGQTVLVGVALDGGEGEVIGDTLLGGRGPDFLFGTPSVTPDGMTQIDPPSLQLDSLAYSLGMTGGGDTLAGGDHNDFLYGNTGSDLLSGGVVTDTLIGGAGGADILVDFDAPMTEGMSYESFFYGDTDVLVGGNGEDLLLTRNPAGDTLYGGQTELLTSEYISEDGPGDLLVGDNIGLLQREAGPVDEGGGTDPAFTVSFDLSFGGVTDYSGLETGDRDVIIAGSSNDKIFGDNLGIPEGGSRDSAPTDTLLDLVSGGLANPALSWTLMGLQSDLGWRHHTNSFGEADNIDAGAGNDLVFGQGGNDEILGGSGIDVIYGGAGDDWIDLGDGLPGDMVGGFMGGELAVGDDLAIGGGGLVPMMTVDTLTDGPMEYEITPPTPELTGGNDVILGDYLGDTLIGDGIISVAESGPSGLQSLDYLGGPAIAGGDDLIIGNGGDDTILGDGLVALSPFLTLDGPSGTALIGGNDTLYGGDGSDVVYGEGNLITTSFNPGFGHWQFLGSLFLPELSGAFDGHDTLYGGGDGDFAGDKLYGNGGNDTLFGDNGDGTGDTVYGDTVYGNAGDDLLYGEAGGDTLYGDDGGFPMKKIAQPDLLTDGPVNEYALTLPTSNDTLYGGTGADTYYGNQGDDLLVYRISDGPGVNVIYGDSGDGNLLGTDDSLLIVNDTAGAVDVTVRPSGDTVNGTEQVEVLVGNDVIAVVDEVEDIVFQAGDAGDTFLLYGDFDPTDVTPTTFIMYGGAGDDELYGADLTSEHHILAYGGGGNDFLEGGPGNDDLYGGADDDTLYGDAQYGGDVSAASGLSDDNLLGDAGNDVLYGDVGTSLYGGTGGSDTLYGGDGDDVGFGDAGTDLYGGAYGGDDVLYGEAGNDSLTGDAGDSLGYGGFDSSRGGHDLLYGGNGEDNLVGDARDGAAYGTTGGNDVIDGGADNDILVGDVGPGSSFFDFAIPGPPFDFSGFDPGDDTLYGGTGDDEIVGDVQGDVLNSFNGVGHDLLYGGDGSDLISGDAVGEGALLGDGGVITGEASRGGNDTIYGEGDFDYIFGDSMDIRDGGIGGDDLIYGGAEGDSIQGDTFFDIRGEGSRGGNDTVYGESGNDLIDGDAAQDQISYGASGGHDLLYGGDGDDVITGETGATTVGSAGSTGLIYGGTGGNDTLYGEGGNDELFGDVSGSLGASLADLSSYGGDDTLYGGVGDDTLFGDAGLGSLGSGFSFVDNGNGGNDLLSGGAGTDTLYGGSGSDIFSIDSTETAGSLLLADLIGDYVDGTDKVQITGVGGISFATAAGDVFVADAATGGFGGSAGDTVIAIDTNLSGAADAGDAIVAVVDGVGAGAFDATDFILVP